MKVLATNVLFIQLVVIVFLVIIDVVVTVAKALGTGKFEWGKLLLFLRTNVARYALVWGVLAAVAWGAQKLGITDGALLAFTVLIDIVYALIIARLSASILGTFKEMEIPVDATDAAGLIKANPEK